MTIKKIYEIKIASDDDIDNIKTKYYAADSLYQASNSCGKNLPIGEHIVSVFLFKKEIIIL